MAYSAGNELSSLAFDKIIGGALDAVVKAQSNASFTTVNFIKQTGFKLNENGEATEPIYVGFKYPKEVSTYQPAQASQVKLQVVTKGVGYTNENIKGYTIGGANVIIKQELDQYGSFLSATILGENKEIVDGADVVILCEDGNVEPAAIKCVKIEAKKEVPAQFQDMELKVPILTMLPIPFIRIASTDIELNVKINSMENTSSSDDLSKGTAGNVSSGYKGFGASVNATFSTSVATQKKSSSTEEIKKEFSLNIKIHAVQDEMPMGISRILDILEESISPKIANTRAEKIQA